MSEKRMQLTVGKVIDHLQKCNRSLPIYTAVSLINLDEPIETQEFINDWEKKKCVAVEFCNEYATIGWAEEENS